MNRLLLIELKRLMPTYLLMWAFGCFALFKFDVWLVLLISPAVNALGSNISMRRSYWYLNLPWSRAKMALSLVYQNTVFLLINLIFVCIIFTIEGKFFYSDDRSFRLTAFAVLYTIAFFLGLDNPIFNGTKIWIRELLQFKFFAMLVGLGLLFYVILKFDLVTEPTFYLFGILYLLVLLVNRIVRNISMPLHSKKKLIIIASAVGGMLFLSAISLGIYGANFGKYHQARSSLYWTQSFPVFMSETRARDLFMKSEMGDYPAMLAHVGYLKSSISLVEWKNRTVKCTDESCLDLSSAVIYSQDLSLTDLSERFLDLMSRCKFELRNNKVTCGTKLSEERLRIWINELNEKGVLSSWLRSDDPKKQIIAIKGLPLDLKEEDKRAIAALTNSNDALVKATAAVAIANIDTFTELRLNCKSSGDDKHAVCKAKREDLAM